MSHHRNSLAHELALALRQAWGELRRAALKNSLDPFPLRDAFKGYGRLSFLRDLRAAASVALLAVPQGMAYAVIAGLPLHYGITCSAIAALVGPVLASSRFTILGPTNATAFMVFSYFATYRGLDQASLMPLLVFMTGSLLIVGAYFRVADLAQYISRTVIVAYVTGAALLIMANQLPAALGIDAAGINGGAAGRQDPATLPVMLLRMAAHLNAGQWASLAVAAGTAACFLTVRKWRPQWPAFAITLVAVSAISALLGRTGWFAVPSYDDARFSWNVLLPPFPDFASSAVLSDMSRLFGISFALAFLATVENSVMAKTLAARSGHRVDANQDMLSLGMANLACAYLSGMPASGSLTRSALNHDSGARTALASMMSGLLCLLAALVLGPAVGFIPKPALAALVMCVAVSLLNRRNIRIALFATRSDGIVFLITLIATLLLPLHVAIFTGVGVSVILFLRKASRPTLIEYEFNPDGQLAEARKGSRQSVAISIVHVEGELFFGAAELFRTQIQRSCADPNLRIIILRLKNARHLDATSVMALDDLLRALRADGRDLIVSGASKDVYRVLRNSGLVDVIGRENIFPGSHANPNLSTRNALKRAQQILGSTEAEVRIFYDPSQQAIRKD